MWVRMWRNCYWKGQPVVLKGDFDLTYAVIGKAMEVHREVGPGLQEPFYHQILSEKLNAGELWHRFKPGGVLAHRGTRADEFEADLLFDGRLVIEAKVLRPLSRALAHGFSARFFGPNRRLTPANALRLIKSTGPRGEWGEPRRWDDSSSP